MKGVRDVFGHPALRTQMHGEGRGSLGGGVFTLDGSRRLPGASD